jgi:hypothetical protein
MKLASAVCCPDTSPPHVALQIRSRWCRCTWRRRTVATRQAAAAAWTRHWTSATRARPRRAVLTAARAGRRVTEVNEQPGPSAQAVHPMAGCVHGNGSHLQLLFPCLESFTNAVLACASSSAGKHLQQLCMALRSTYHLWPRQVEPQMKLLIPINHCERLTPQDDPADLLPPSESSHQRIPQTCGTSVSHTQSCSWATAAMLPLAAAPLPTTGVAAAARLAFAAAAARLAFAAAARLAAAAAAATALSAAAAVATGTAGLAVPLLGHGLVSAAAMAGPAVPALGGRRIATATTARLPLWAARPLCRTPPMRSCIWLTLPRVWQEGAVSGNVARPATPATTCVRS